MTEQQLPLTDELAHVFARMSGLLLSRRTVGAALSLITSLAAEVLPGTAGAAVTLLDRDLRVTRAATDPDVEMLDTRQYELDEGPCLTAGTTGGTVRVDDTATEVRWPRWCAAAADAGFRSSLSAGLVAGGVTLGAIKVYATEASAYDSRSEYLIQMFAAQAALVLASVRSVEDAARVSEQLRQTVRSRDVVSIAKGILMCREQVTEAEAFTMLIALERADPQGLRSVAEELIRSTPRRLR